MADAPAAADAPAPAARPEDMQQTTAKLRGEADRLALLEGDSSYAAAARALGERLRTVANLLLQQAEFNVRTNVQGRLQQANGAFQTLLAPTITGTADASQIEQNRVAIQRAWETALAAAPLGRSTLFHPVPDQSFPSWNLHRTAILDERNKAEQAFLYVFRSANAPQLDRSVFEQVELQLPALAIYASLCAYGTAQEYDKLQELESIVAQLEQLAASAAA
jgi:hypothetical protein